MKLKFQFFAITLVALAGLVGLTRCSKEHTNSNTLSAKTTSDPSSDTIAVVKNSSNPYDTVGARHNNAMRVIVPYYQNGLQPTDTNVWSKTTAYLVSSGYSSANLSFLKSSCAKYIGDTLNGMVTDSIATWLYKRKFISSKVESYLTSMGNLLNAMADTVTQANYTTFANGMISLESTILTDGTLDSSERIYVLCAASVGRYSVDYWMNYADTTQDGIGSLIKRGFSPMTQSGGGSRGWFNWQHTTGQDISGAIVGAGVVIVASIVADVPPSPSAVVTGAVGTAITLSVSDAVSQIWDHWFD